MDGTDNAVPGLAFDTTTRTLTGTPNTAATTALTYTVTDQNGSTASATFSITVAPGVTLNDQTYTAGRPIPALTLPAGDGGTGTLTYTLTGPAREALNNAVPGLTFTATTRVLSGTPTEEGMTAMTYAATDEHGSTASAGFTITVNEADTAPAFAAGETVAAQTYEQNTAITPLTLPLATGGNGAITYTLTGPNGTDVSELPTGLTYAANARTISGTPTAPTAAPLAFTWTAADKDDNTAADDTDTLDFSITVNEADTAPAFAAGVSIDDQTYTLDAEITPLTLPLATGGTGTLAYTLRDADGNDVDAVDNAVPGLTFTASTRILTGTPTVVPTTAQAFTASTRTRTRTDTPTTAQTFSANTRPPTTATMHATTALTYTVTDENGSTASAGFNITVNEAPNAAPTFAAGTGIADQIYTMGAEIPALTLPAATGGDGPITYAMTPLDELPDGLLLDPVTRTLTGTPTLATATLTFTWTAADTATNNMPSDTVALDFQLTVNMPDTPPAFAAGTSIDDQEYMQGTAIEPLTLPAVETDGNGATTYTLTPLTSLPDGLTYTVATRTLTGTPTTALTATMFTWTAMDADDNTAATDTATLTFSITVNASNIDLTPVAEQWLARFGRGVTTQAVETIGDRMTGVSSPESQLTLGGRQFSLTDLARGYASPGVGNNGGLFGAAGWAGSHQPALTGSHQPALTGSHQPALTGSHQPALTGSHQPALTGSHQPALTGSHQPIGSQSAAGGAMPADFALTQRTRSMSFSEVMRSSSFDLSLSGDASDEDTDGKPMTLWGRVSTGSFDGEPAGMSLNGNLATGYLGLDYRTDRALLGIAVARTESEGNFRLEDTAGELEATLTSAYPYLSWSLSDELAVWGMLGFGEGKLKLREDTQDLKTDIQMQMVALGLRSVLPSVWLVDLAVKADIFALQIKSDAVTGENLNATNSNARRLRVMLEASSNWPVSEHATVTPSLELGTRWDGGDADTGMGIELGGGFTWHDTRLGLELAARGRTLLNHGESGFKEWGASLSFLKTVGSDGQGLAFVLTPTWGQASSGVDSLWSSEPAGAGAGLLPRDSTQGSTSATPDQLEFELSWGMLRPRGLLMTPYMQMRMAQGRMDSVREGLRLQFPRGVSLEVFGEHNLQPGQPADHGIGLTARIDL